MENVDNFLLAGNQPSLFCFVRFVFVFTSPEQPFVVMISMSVPFSKSLQCYLNYTNMCAVQWTV